jgi:hypothetical protein
LRKLAQELAVTKWKMAGEAQREEARAVRDRHEGLAG